MSLWRLALAVVPLLLAGCAGIATVPAYSVPSGEQHWWGKQSPDNPIVSVHEGVFVQMQLSGNWKAFGLIGPLPVPLIPHRGDAHIFLTIETERPEHALEISDALLVIDGRHEIGPTLRRTVGHGPGLAVQFRFETPPMYPRTVEVRLAGTGAIAGLPPATLRVGKELCYWTGDTGRHYNGCKNAQND